MTTAAEQRAEMQVALATATAHIEGLTGAVGELTESVKEGNAKVDDIGKEVARIAQSVTDHKEEHVRHASMVRWVGGALVAIVTAVVGAYMKFAK